MEAYSSGEDLVVKVISLQLLSRLFFSFSFGGWLFVLCSLFSECGSLWFVEDSETLHDNKAKGEVD